MTGLYPCTRWSEGSRVYVVLCARTVPDEPIGAIERTAIAELRGRLKWLREELFGRQAVDAAPRSQQGV